MKVGQRPGKVFGQTTAAAINEIAEYLSKTVAEHDLPEKALTFHQVNRYVVKDEPTLRRLMALKPAPEYVMYE